MYKVIHDECVKFQEMFVYTLNATKKNSFDPYPILNNRGDSLIFTFFCLEASFFH